MYCEAPDLGARQPAGGRRDVRRHRGGVLHDVAVEDRVRVRAGVAGELVGLIHPLVVRGVVEVRRVDVVVGLDAATVQEDVDEVRRIRVVGEPTLEGQVERLTAGRRLLVLHDAVEQLDLDVDPDLLQVELHGLGDGRTGRRVVRVHHGLAVPRVALGEGLRLRVVRALQRVDVEVLEARHPVRDELVGAEAAEVAVLRHHEPTVDRVRHCLPELRVVLEDAARRVHREVPVADLRLDVELALVDAVLVGELLRLCRREAAQVGLATLTHEPLRRGVRAGDPADLIDVGREAERLERLLVVLPVRVADRKSGALDVPLLEVVRACRDDRRLDALRREREVDRHGGEEHHRHPGHEVRSDVLQGDREGLARSAL